MPTKKRVVKKSRRDSERRFYVESIIRASLILMDDFQVRSDAYAITEQIRELAGKLEDIVIPEV